MKTRGFVHASLALVLSATELSAAELDQKTLLLIDPSATMVASVDVERHAKSALDRFFPMGSCFGARERGGNPRRTIEITGGEGDTSWRYSIVIGVPPAADPAQAVPGPGEETYEGVVLARNGHRHCALFAAVDGQTVVTGDLDRMRDAIDRWNRKEAPTPNSVAAKVQELSRSFDSWIYTVKPLQQMAHERSVLGKHAAQLIDAVEEFRAGLRFGPLNRFQVEVLLKTEGDASALAAFTRWLPGLIQLMNPHGFVPPSIVDLAEDIRSGSAGRSVFLSFSIEDAGLLELERTLMSKQPKEPAVDPPF